MGILLTICLCLSKNFNKKSNYCQKLLKKSIRRYGGRGIEGFACQANGRDAISRRRWRSSYARRWRRSTEKGTRKTRAGHGHEEQYLEPSSESRGPSEIEYNLDCQTRKRCSS